MLTNDWLPPHMLPVSLRILGLWISTMLRPQPLKQSLDWLRKPLISRNLRGPSCVSARGWDLQKSEDCDSRGLVLVRDVGVVACCCKACGAALGTVEVVGAEVDVVEFDVVLDVGSYRLLHGINIYPERIKEWELAE
jgi:hypothetical protein